MEWLDVITETVKISLLIFVMMVLVELFEVKFSGRLRHYFIENRSFKYVLSSLLGVVPGCAGTFIVDSLYMAGITGFGGIVAAMIATMGDEAFYLISLTSHSPARITPVFILGLFSLLVLLGIAGGFFADVIVRRFNIAVCKKCVIDKHVEADLPKMDWNHFIRVHIWSHIFKQHIVKIFFWVLGSLVLVTILNEAYDLQASIAENKILFLVIAGILGIAPVSGPNVIIITLFANGNIPFSILITNTIVQDGHGLLPLLGFSLEDSFKIKLFNLAYGYLVGFILFAAGS